MMSFVPVAEDGVGACANCGKHGSETVKLKNCTACRLVKYCSVDCQKAHRKQHKKACKQRSAELKDERLYSQGHERSEEEFCPICTQPVPIPTNKHSNVNTCCMKMVCNGCLLAAMRRGIQNKCPFCRSPGPEDDAESLKSAKARVDKKDPEAINFLGDQFMKGGLGLEKDASRAVELWTEAAELGLADAHYNLGLSYYSGQGVEKDVGRGVSFYEKAAMRGHAGARHNLGCLEGQNRNWDRAVRHFLISAKMGDKDSLGEIKKLFKYGHAAKSQYAESLKCCQDSMEEMKSPGRDEAKHIFDQYDR